jgi:SAM-dependent methyltransferase
VLDLKANKRMLTLNGFYAAIKNISAYPLSEKFLAGVEVVFQQNQSDQSKLNSLTVLFEGYYHAETSDPDLKKELLALRVARWKNHAGMPTIGFLTTYRVEIEKLAAFFQDFDIDLSADQGAIRELFDESNHVFVDEHAIDSIPLPEQAETLGVFVKTYNPIGGYTLPAVDPFSQKFIECAGQAGVQGDRALEIGAAFGAATLKALAQGAQIDCNDISVGNLAVVAKRFAGLSDHRINRETAEYKNLRLLPGAFPEELAGLQSDSYQAILACRVLHFFSGKKIESCLQVMADLLAPGGKLFIVCETPYQKNWISYLPEFESKAQTGVEWPGEITDSSRVENTQRNTGLPKFMHLISQPELLRAVKKVSNLKLLECAYISRQGVFSDDALLDGRESVGLIAERL